MAISTDTQTERDRALAIVAKVLDNGSVEQDLRSAHQAIERGDDAASFKVPFIPPGARVQGT